jgi:hypothetical protein
VTPYTFKAPIDKIKPLYLQAIKYTKGARAVIHYVNSNFGNQITTLQNHTAQIKRDSPQAASFNTLAPPPDSSVLKMLSDISAFPENSKLRGGGSHKKNHTTRRTRLYHYTPRTHTRKKPFIRVHHSKKL